MNSEPETCGQECIDGVRPTKRQGDLSLDARIANANIDHIKKLLKAETDVAKRALLERLLAEEHAKLGALKCAEPRE